jgi:hypothetical protein
LGVILLRRLGGVLIFAETGVIRRSGGKPTKAAACPDGVIFASLVGKINVQEKHKGRSLSDGPDGTVHCGIVLAKSWTAGRRGGSLEVWQKE